jgi:hypothetical protein
MIVRDFGNGFSVVVDWTEEVNTVPNQWGLIGQLGIFQEEAVSEHVVVFEEIIKDGALIVDRVRVVIVVVSVVTLSARCTRSRSRTSRWKTRSSRKTSKVSVLTDRLRKLKLLTWYALVSWHVFVRTTHGLWNSLVLKH